MGFPGGMVCHITKNIKHKFISRLNHLKKFKFNGKCNINTRSQNPVGHFCHQMPKLLHNCDDKTQTLSSLI